MKDQHYKNRTIRLNEKTWERFKKARKESGLSCNLFLMVLLNWDKKRGNERQSSVSSGSSRNFPNQGLSKPQNESEV